MGVIIPVLLNISKIVVEAKTTEKSNRLLSSSFEKIRNEVYPKNILGRRKLCKELRKK